MNKLGYKPKKCNFIGYRNGVKGYKHWNPLTNKKFYICNVNFKEVKKSTNMEEQPK